MGIGPNNLGPDGKAGYTSCGHPKKSPLKKMHDGGMYKLDSGMYKTVESLDGPGQTPLAFNEKLEKLRKTYRSLFLVNYRNSTASYSRKRISFSQCYRILIDILEKYN